MPAQAAIADYLQHGGYDRHLRKLRYALEGQQANMLAAIARYFPAQTRVSQPSGATSCGWNCPSRWTLSNYSTWRWPRASASPRADLFADPPLRQLHSPELRQPLA
ncbi:hypothetical protein PspTeo4_10448 [Pseudomonas sp. Teo4]|nr:hypothetical protein [Pseudomonas sp. Teo4]